MHDFFFPQICFMLTFSSTHRLHPSPLFTLSLSYPHTHSLSHSPTHSFSQSDHSHTWSSEVISAIRIPLGEILILLEEIYPVVKTEPMPINKVIEFKLILIICFVNCFCYWLLNDRFYYSMYLFYTKGIRLNTLFVNLSYCVITPSII